MKNSIFWVFTLLVASTLFFSCKKEEAKGSPKFENQSISQPNPTTAKVQVDIVSGGEKIIQYGIVRTQKPDDPISVGVAFSVNGNGGRIDTSISLFFGIKNYIRVYAITEKNIYFGKTEEVEYKNYHEFSYKGGKMMVATINNDLFFSSWNQASFFFGATDSADGAINTDKVYSQSASNSPIAYCHNLVLNGYSDWYLPAIEELEFMAQNRQSLNLRFNRYWSSTELNINDVLTIDMNQPSNVVAGPKNNFAYCRCVRRE